MDFFRNLHNFDSTFYNDNYSYMVAVMKWINRILDFLEGKDMQYQMMSDHELKNKRAILRAQLSTHAHADRMGRKERTRYHDCKWKLEQIRTELFNRKSARDDVGVAINSLKDRWSR